MIRQVTEGDVPEPIKPANATLAKMKAPVNPLVGGFGRFTGLLLQERTLQLFLFPLVLRSVHDNDLLGDTPLAVQTLASGAVVGAMVSGVKYPCDKLYVRHV